MPGSGRALIERLYQAALGRAPTHQERQLAEDLVGQPARKEGVEDFLWAMTMLPARMLPATRPIPVSIFIVLPSAG